MIQTETKIYRHELSVALAKARLFRSIRLTWIAIGTKRREVEKKKKKSTKNKQELKNVTIDSML